jgi:hypothetical protein
MSRRQDLYPHDEVLRRGRNGDAPFTQPPSRRVEVRNDHPVLRGMVDGDPTLLADVFSVTEKVAEVAGDEEVGTTAYRNIENVGFFGVFQRDETRTSQRQVRRLGDGSEHGISRDGGEQLVDFGARNTPTYLQDLT